MRSLRVVSYNVRYFGHGTRGLASTKRSMTRIAEALANLTPRADVICLQEVETSSLRSTLVHPSYDGETQLERLMTMLRRSLLALGRRDAYEAYYFPAHTYGPGVAPIYTTGLAVIAHRDFHVAHHNASAPHDITHVHRVKRLKQTRICAHLRLESKWGELDVFNTHLSLPSALSKEFWFEPKRMGWGPNQVKEAKNLVSFVKETSKNDRFVVVGDFNALPGSPVYRTLRESGLRDGFAEFWDFGESELVKWPTAGFMNMRMHLDHVFCGDGIEFIDFEGTHRFGQRNGIFRGLSDHVPIVGAFHLR